jgi:predicted heme/steroid binding protein
MVPKIKENVTAPAVRGGTTFYTAEQVEQHNKTNDVWLIVRDAVYDVTKFVDRHPGGDLILLQKGRDVTSMFESLHPDEAQKTLEKYKIGSVAPGSVRNTVTFPPAEHRNFYPTLKARVADYFRKSGEKRRDTPRMYVKALGIVCFTLVSWYAPATPPPPLPTYVSNQSSGTSLSSLPPPPSPSASYPPSRGAAAWRWSAWPSSTTRITER